MRPRTTEERIISEAKRMVRGEKVADLVNDPRQFIHRLAVGYYSDRLVFHNRWLVNDEQQQIDAYYGKQ